MSQVNLKGNPIHINGNLPSKGHPAPDFTLVDNELKDRHLTDFKGKKKLISIVPSLDTSVCLTSTKKFNEAAKQHPNAVFLTVSADLPFAQGRHCKTENIQNVITLSMMRTKEFAKDYGILIIDGPLAGVCARGIVVLDETDQVIYTQLVDEITKEPDYDEALKHLA